MEFIDLEAQQDQIRSDIDSAIEGVLDHGQYILGPEVEELEEGLGSFSGAEHVITCGNGTDALMLSLQALGIEPGDVVFVPTFTFAATAEAVAYLGGSPCFIDVEVDTFNLDPVGLEEALESRAELRERAVGVIPVDLFGHPADYGQIREVADEHGLWILSDAAQSFGATRAGSRAGTLGDVTITSFFPAKPLGAYGDGGAVLTDNASLADTVRSLRVHGKGEHKYENTRVGMNSRLDSMQAAILLEKLTVFEEELENRRRIAELYRHRLGKTVAPPLVQDEVDSAWAQYTVKLPDGTARLDLRSQMEEAGVPTAVYYQKPLHQQPAYQEYPRQGGQQSLSVSERLAQRVLSLPMHPYLTEEQVSRVCRTLAAALQPSNGAQAF